MTTANSFAPVIHEDHGNVMGLVAEFPIASEDPDSKEPGSLDLGDKELRTIKFVSESTLMRDLVKDPEVVKDLYVVACACLDYKNQKVYTFNSVHQHARLCQVFGLDSTQEQIWVNEGLIFGFVTASGHFFNRETMYFVLSKHHPKILKPAACGSWFNSEMINWKEVMNNLDARA